MLRFHAKQDAEKTKASIMEKFEALKKKGRFGPDDLSALDLGPASPKEETHASALTKTLSPV